MNTPLPDKVGALQSIVSLMEDNDIKIKDIKRAHARHKKGQAPETAASKNEKVVSLFLYIGGAFIFAGLSTFIGLLWDSLGGMSRTIITLGTGIVALVLGFIFLPNDAMKKAANPAFIISGLLVPTGWLVFLKEFFGGDDAALGTMVAFGASALMFILPQLKIRNGIVFFFSIIFSLGFIAAFVEKTELDIGFSALVTGLALFFICLNFYTKKAFRDCIPFFFILSSLLFFGGLYDQVALTTAAPLIISVTLAYLYFSKAYDSGTLYVMAIIFILASVPMSFPDFSFSTQSYDDFTSLLLTVQGISFFLTALWLRKDNPDISFLWFFGSMVLTLAGFTAYLFEKPYEILFLLVACGAIYVSLTVRNRAALAASIIAMVSYITYYSEKHFADVISWPVLMIFLGFLFLGAGYAYIRLSKKLMHSNGQTVQP